MNDGATGNVYFLMLRDSLDPARDLGLVKIGITSDDLSRRIATLQTGNPYEIILFDTLETSCPREVEHFMHRTHASEMLRTEWIRCRLEDLPALVREATEAADRIQRRKDQELRLANVLSNGRTRRATRAEFNLHRQARNILRSLLPAKLRLRRAEALIHAATCDSSGIDGVVTVKWVPLTARFDRRFAETHFAAAIASCQVSAVKGTFRWRRVPRLTDFPEEYTAERSANQLAQKASVALMGENALLGPRIPRSHEVECWHDLYLDSLRLVNSLEIEVADLQTELTQALGEFDALDPICSFVRRSAARLDTLRFQSEFPDQYRECLVPVTGRLLRKVIYPNRSYLRLDS